MNKGRIVLVSFPYSDLQGLKRRPGCVVSNERYNLGSPDVILAMITSSRRRIEQPGLGDAVIRDWEWAGLRLPSVARTGRLLVVERRLLGESLGDLSSTDLQSVDASLRIVLDLP